MEFAFVRGIAETRPLNYWFQRLRHREPGGIRAAAARHLVRLGTSILPFLYSELHRPLVAYPLALITLRSAIGREVSVMVSAGRANC